MISARLVLKSRRLIRPCALCFMLALGASPRAFAETITNGGANIFINFNNPLDCNVIFNGQLPAVQNLVLEGLSVDIDVGGFQKHYVLDANGQVAQASDFFELANNDTNTGLTFTMNSIAANLDQLYAPLGLTNTDVSNAAVSMNVSIAFNETTYTATLSGSYYAQAGKAGKAFLGAIKAPKDPFKPVFHFRFVHAKPNPLLAGETTTFKGEVSLTDLTGDVKGHLIFGDGTAGVHAPGKQFQQMLSEGITHSYASEGIYTAHIHIIGDNEIIATRVFVVVGREIVVNSKNGLTSQLIHNGGGTVTLNLTVESVPGAVNAKTFFKDLQGNDAGMPPVGTLGIANPRATPEFGLSVQRVFTDPGIFVAESHALDSASNSLAYVRKTIVIGSADLGASPMARSDGTEAATPRDVPPAVITLNSMHGKFQFTSSKLDKVNFSGTITLPAGFEPKNPAGNDIAVSMGNVIDTIHLDSHRRLVLPTATSRVTRFKIVPPHLPTGVATGMETARVNIDLNVADLDVLGFDSEGITVSVRSDEQGQSPVDRFIQVDMLIQGQSFSAVVPVDYTVSSSGFGSITGR